MKNKTPDLIDLHVPFLVVDSQAIVGVIQVGWFANSIPNSSSTIHTIHSFPFKNAFHEKKQHPQRHITQKLPRKGRLRVSFWDGKHVKSIGRAVELPGV